MAKERKIIDSEQIRRALTRISHEIIERNKGVDNIALIGIRTGGAHLAKRIQESIQNIEKKEVALGIVDITLYRDDLIEIGPQPAFKGTEIDFDISGKIVILVDDVLYTGRTIRCALDQLIDLGRPKAIQLAVLVDRGHRELPVKADYVGKNIPTQPTENVTVRLKEAGGNDEIFILQKEAKNDG